MNVQKKLAFALVRAKLHALSLLSSEISGREAFRLFTTPPKRSSRVSPLFAAAEEISFPLNGHLVKGYRVNHPQPKKALILHGFTSSCHSFDRYVSPLVEKGYEVIAFNAPAHGNSGGKTVNAVEYAVMIREICNRFGPIAAFIGHSFGGLAISLALEQQDHGPETRVVLIAPATETVSAIDSAFRILGFKNGDRIKKDMEDYILHHSGQQAGWYSVNRAIKNLKANILWIHDEDDEVTPLADTLPSQQASLPNLKFRITRGLGHHQIYRDPAIVSEVTEFLS